MSYHTRWIIRNIITHCVMLFLNMPVHFANVFKIVGYYCSDVWQVLSSRMTYRINRLGREEELLRKDFREVLIIVYAYWFGKDRMST